MVLAVEAIAWALIPKEPPGRGSGEPLPEL